MLVSNIITSITIFWEKQKRKSLLHVLAKLPGVEALEALKLLLCQSSGSAVEEQNRSKRMDYTLARAGLW